MPKFCVSVPRRQSRHVNTSNSGIIEPKSEEFWLVAIRQFGSIIDESLDIDIWIIHR